MRIISIAATVLALTGSLLADQITMKNGDRLTGAITKLDDEKLSLKSEFAGEVKVPWSAIEQISSNQPLYVTLKDEQVIVGSIATTDGKITVRTKEAGDIDVSKSAVRTIRSPEEQATYQAEIDRLRNPRLGDFWSGFADAGLSLTKGNADTTTLGTAMKAARTTSRDKISVYFTSLFAKNSTDGKSVTTANALFGGSRYDFNLSDRVFVFGQSDLEHNELQHLDLRFNLAGGLGLHAVKTERTLIDLFAGGSFDEEFFSTNVTRRSAEILLGEELSHKLSASTSFTERAAFYPNLSETGEYRFTFDTSAATKLRNWLAWHVTFSDRFVSNPIPGVKKNDVLLTTGIRLTFGTGKGL
ncbi:MAG TPA: DUF481 domain-containing protein [Acidobacteriota bacterium]|nr:DUF481 domain-containing protein [Acidobacteriota bacterium]